MFDDIIREVKRLERGIKVSVPIPEDEKGYVDRKCPSNNCSILYKVFGSDWDQKIGKKRAFCPLCRHEAPSDKWATPQQRKHVEAVAMRELRNQFHDALESGARSFNRRPQSGFLTFSLSVTRDRTPVFLPRAVGDIMEQAFTCEACSCRYSSIGAAFFCPACGHNSALSTFRQTLETVRNTMGAMKKIKESFGGDEDAAENAARMVIEQAVGKLVGAFERFAEALFAKTPGAPLSKVKRGSFQRLPEASALWREALGKGYEDFLDPKEFADLLRLFQKRHLLMHCDGVVDAEYIQKSGDHEYAAGQRIVIREAHVLRLSTLVGKIRDELRKLVP
jgi:hypothetical protein